MSCCDVFHCPLKISQGCQHSSTGIQRCSLNSSLPVNLSPTDAAVVPDPSDAFFCVSVLVPRVLFADPATAGGYFSRHRNKNKQSGGAR